MQLEAPQSVIARERAHAEHVRDGVGAQVQLLESGVAAQALAQRNGALVLEAAIAREVELLERRVLRRGLPRRHRRDGGGYLIQS